MAKAEKRIQQHDFQSLFEQHHDAIYYWFVRHGVEPETSRELTQDTFLAAFKNLASFRGEASFKVWLLRIARNIFRNYLRDKQTLKRKAVEVSLSPRPDAGEDSGAQLQIPDPDTSTPEDRLLEREREQAVQETLSSLPTKMRQTVELRLAGLKYREIGEIMGLSIDTVKSHLYQARHKLRGDENLEKRRTR